MINEYKQYLQLIITLLLSLNSQYLLKVVELYKKNHHFYPLSLFIEPSKRLLH